MNRTCTKIIEICEPQKCTACGSCLNICPAKAISFIENKFGELHPHIDSEKCISCGLCLKKCPNNVENKFHAPQHCFAAWITNKANRAECASGGVATFLSEYTLKEKNGVVFGTAYDADMVPRLTWTEKLEDLQKFKGSKYVQSITDDAILKKAADFLASGRFVLFIGTPCQIAGLRSFLNDTPQNLITADLICHGVCPVRYFKDETEYLKKHYHLEKISNIRFRGNDEDNSKLSFYERLIGRYNSNNYKFSIWSDSDETTDRTLEYRGSPSENFYLAGFLKGVTLRENCYTCSYARPERIADITLGDFIGLGETVKFDYPTANVSVVLTNTEKGEAFYAKAVEDGQTLYSIERTYDERLNYPYSLTKPFPRHKLNAKFRRLYSTLGYRPAIEKTLRCLLFQEKICSLLTHWLRLPGYAWCIMRDKIKTFCKRNF